MRAEWVDHGVGDAHADGIEWAMCWLVAIRCDLRNSLKCGYNREYVSITEVVSEIFLNSG